MSETAPVETFTAAPASVKPIRAGIDTAMAINLWNVAMANETGVTNGVIYPSTEDESYTATVARLRKHLASRLNDTQRVKVVPYVNGDGVSFSLQIATKRARKTKA